MSLEEFLAEQLGNIPHRHRSAVVWEGVRAGIEGAGQALMVCSMFADSDSLVGRDRVEDFELKPTGQVNDEDLKRLVLSYYALEGWALTDERLNCTTMFSVERQGADGTEHLDVCITNDSRNPHIPAGCGIPEIYPQIQVTCSTYSR